LLGDTEVGDTELEGALPEVDGDVLGVDDGADMLGVTV
jgi:hypothetical protein